MRQAALATLTVVQSAAVLARTTNAVSPVAAVAFGILCCWPDSIRDRLG